LHYELTENKKSPGKLGLFVVSAHSARWIEDLGQKRLTNVALPIAAPGVAATRAKARHH
jgi:hypothetical protein